MLMRMILVLTALLLLPCRSARVETSERRGNCYETSNGLVNAQGWGCDVYYHTEGMCGKYDGNGFNSMEMCCACNGGYWPEADTNQEKHGEQDSCHGFTCDEWIEKNPAYTCSYLTDAFGCDCSTSSCSTHCPATCGGFRCDDWIDSDHAYSCGLLQHSYGCDCAGCECKTHVAALTDGYSLLENADTGNSGDCMNHCVDCDHTWLPTKSTQSRDAGPFAMKTSTRKALTSGVTRTVGTRLGKRAAFTTRRLMDHPPTVAQCVT